MLGLSVGVAQLFKYNGWIGGVLVAIERGALACCSVRDARTPKTMLATWGWGLLFAALVAAIVYWPWFRFVESHGGYAALLAHHRGYRGRDFARGSVISTSNSHKRGPSPRELRGISLSRRCGGRGDVGAATRDRFRRNFGGSVGPCFPSGSSR